MTELHKMLLFSDQRLLYTFLAVLLLAGSWKLIAKLAKRNQTGPQTDSSRHDCGWLERNRLGAVRSLS